MVHQSVPAPSIELDGTGLRIGIVVARYNWPITGSMLALAREELSMLGVSPEQVQVMYVPGSFELPQMARAMLARGTYDALICFGCVMKGATRHDVVVADAAAQGLQQVALRSGVPVILGVMCAENQQQAEERIPRGRECARAAVEMARAFRALYNNSCYQEREWYQEQGA